MVSFLIFLFSLVCLFTVNPDHMALIWQAPWPQYLVGWLLYGFGHANFQHLFGNWLFGIPYLLYAEHTMQNAKKFFSSYLGLALGSALFVRGMIALGVDQGSGVIGSSGVIFGFFMYGAFHYNGSKGGMVLLRTLAGVAFLNQVFSAIVAQSLGISFLGHVGGGLCGLGLLYGASAFRKLRNAVGF